jgi:carboxyl-terminal processing protease
MISKKIIYGVVLSVSFVAVFGLGFWIGKIQSPYFVPQPETLDFSLFWDAYKKLQQNFITPEKIDNQKIVYGAISGMTKSLGDPYTDFFDPDEAKKFQQDLSGSFDGIGVEIGIKNKMLTVIAPLEGTPGKQAGLKAGDIIVKINKQESTDMTTDEAVNLIRGPKGTSVTLTIVRNGWTSTKDFTIVRQTIKIPAIKWSLKDNNVAYIQIFQFNENLSADFKTAALQILQSPAKSVVLDLRDNPGGYLQVAQDVAGWFLENGKTVTIEDFGNAKEKHIYKAEGAAELAHYPLVILINQGSASASEILAGALRDNRGIKLIGTKSFGKGSVQEVVNLRGGSFLKITIAKWLTPKGASISEVGLEPDIKSEISEEDTKTQKDSQLEKALEIIKGLK